MDETTELCSHCIQLKNFAYEVATAQTKLENIYKNYGNLNFLLTFTWSCYLSCVVHNNWWFLCILFFSIVLSLFSLLYSFFSLSLSLYCFCAGLLLGTQDLQPNRILLVTIHHLLYPITVEVLHQVFSSHGLVEKIVTFQKSAGQIFQVFFFSFTSLLSLTHLWLTSKIDWSTFFLLVFSVFLERSILVISMLYCFF